MGGGQGQAVGAALDIIEHDGGEEDRDKAEDHTQDVNKAKVVLVI